MPILYPDAGLATERTMARLGYRARPIPGCCGALHAHNGLLDKGKAMAAKIAEGADGQQVVVNSAGCGSWLKDCGLDVVDITELLAKLPPTKSPPKTVTYHDACHHKHAQGLASPPRLALAKVAGVTLVEMANSDRCCGSAGLYSFLHPQTARALVREKVATIKLTNADYVLSGNPGCLMWIGRGPDSPRVLHIVEFVECCASGLEP